MTQGGYCWNFLQEASLLLTLMYNYFILWEFQKQKSEVYSINEFFYE